MISVQNLLQRSNGNKLFLIIISCVLVQCAPKSSGPLVGKPEKNPVEKPSTDKKTSNLPTKIDTVVFTEKKKTDFPTKTTDTGIPKNDPAKKETKSPVSGVKDNYTISMLMPFKTAEFDSSSTIPRSSMRFVHFYSGAKLAMEELQQESSKFTINIHDADLDLEVTKSVLQKQDISKSDFIIGPYKIDALKHVAEFGKTHQIPVFSPWISSSTISNNNPYYIQAKAGLNEHYKMINRHVRKNYASSQVIVINRKSEDSKGKFFVKDDGSDSFIEKQLSESDLETGANPVVAPILKESGPTVFIVPMFSAKDENFIYNFLRRVSNESAGKEVVIYGLSKWLEYKQEVVDYLNRLNVRISVSNYVDVTDPDVKSFRKKYFDAYKEFPTEDALEGYDIMLFVGKNTARFGKYFYLNNENSNQNYLETTFNIAPVFRSAGTNNPMDANYFENKFVRLVQIRNYKYKTID